MTEVERWKCEQARAWCNTIKQLSRRLQEREAAIEDLRSRYDIQAMHYDRQGGASTLPDDKLARMIDDMDALSADWMQTLSQWRDELAVFGRALRRIDGMSDALLTARYVRGMRWKEIARAMGYTANHASNYLHTQALLELYEVMPPAKRDTIPDALEDS